MKREQGFTLVEVMIALTLTLIALGTIYATMLADTRTYETTQSSLRLIKKGKMSLYTLRLYAQQAGYRELDQLISNQKPGPDSSDTTGGWSWNWQDGQIIQALNNQTTFPDAKARTDVLAIRFYGSEAINGEVYRCNGKTLGKGKLDTMVFYVSTSDELTCVDDTGTVTYDSGIEDLQFDFALDSATSAPSYNYVTADAVTDWNNVGHFRVAALTSQRVLRAPAAESQTYQVLGETIAATPGPFVRQVVRDTVIIHNN